MYALVWTMGQHWFGQWFGANRYPRHCWLSIGTSLWNRLKLKIEIKIQQLPLKRIRINMSGKCAPFCFDYNVLWKTNQCHHRNHSRANLKRFIHGGQIAGSMWLFYNGGTNGFSYSYTYNCTYCALCNSHFRFCNTILCNTQKWEIFGL